MARKKYVVRFQRSQFGFAEVEANSAEDACDMCFFIDESLVNWFSTGTPIPIEAAEKVPEKMEVNTTKH